MKVGLISYPMLFQRTGGLQVQVRETLAALQRCGSDAALVDTLREKLDRYDVIHVFSAINGNHRALETARSMGCATILSPLLRPFWSRGMGARARFAERIAGRLTRWTVRTEYDQLAAALRCADAIVGLGAAELDRIAAAFDAPRERMHVIPNGVGPSFFAADREAARRRFDLGERFVLNVAAINGHKNQLMLAEALADTGLMVVLVGPCLPEHRPYLEAILRYSHVRYLGELDPAEPLLASVYAAASVMALPSHDEVMPLAVIESLAAGTPVVMTKFHCMEVPADASVIKQVDPRDKGAIRTAVLSLLSNCSERDVVRATVRRFSWDSVAVLLIAIYEDCHRVRQADYRDGKTR